jgi:hypothetical protein
LEKDLITP